MKEIADKGSNAIAVQGDVSKPADIARLFAETKKAYGKLNILVNNAGMYQFAPLESRTLPQSFQSQCLVISLTNVPYQYCAACRDIPTVSGNLSPSAFSVCEGIRGQDSFR